MTRQIRRPWPGSLVVLPHHPPLKRGEIRDTGKALYRRLREGRR